MIGSICMKRISKAKNEAFFPFLAICFSIQVHAQDSSRVQLKTYLGVLTLTDTYKNDANWGKSEQGIVGEHFQRLVRMQQEGRIMMAGRTQLESNYPAMMGLVIFYAKDDNEAFRLMMEDPAVKKKIMLAKVYPYVIAVGSCK